jgi:hypothetical protein
MVSDLGGGVELISGELLVTICLNEGRKLELIIDEGVFTIWGVP